MSLLYTASQDISLTLIQQALELSVLTVPLPGVFLHCLMVVSSHRGGLLWEEGGEEESGERGREEGREGGRRSQGREVGRRGEREEVEGGGERGRK